MKSFFKIILFFLLFQSLGFAQDSLEIIKFNTKYYDALDKWVAFPKSEKDSTYLVGFIYLDQMAGFTLRVGDSFKVNKNKLIPTAEKIPETTIIKYRLEPDTRLIAVLNSNQLSQLNLAKEPDWLEIFNDGEDTIEYFKTTGYHFNHVGASHNAIAPLLKAYEKEPSFDGLVFELGFAYNATKQYKKAISILEKEIKTSKDQLLYKELGYAYMNLKDVINTEKVYKDGIKYAKDENYKAEMAINMCALLLNMKDKKKLKKWLKISRKYINEKSPYKQHLNYFENENEKLK